MVAAVAAEPFDDGLECYHDLIPLDLRVGEPQRERCAEGGDLIPICCNDFPIHRNGVPFLIGS